MPFEFDDQQGSAGGFVFEDEAKPVDSTRKLSPLDIANGAGAALGDWATSFGGAVGSTLQAPADSALAAFHGSAALLDRGATWAGKKLGMDTQVDPAVQAQAQSASQEAQAQREANINVNDGTWLNPRTAIARFGLGLQDASRNEGARIQGEIRQNNPELARQQKAMGDAEGFFGNIVAAYDNPAALSYTLLRSLPDMLMGIGFARLSVSKKLEAANSIADAAASKVAAAGGDAAAQATVRKTTLDAISSQAESRASTVGMLSEGGSSAYNAREGTYKEVAGMPLDNLANSPRFKELTAQNGGDPYKAREALANELADQTLALSGLATVAGTKITNKLFGGDATAKSIVGAERMSVRELGKRVGQDTAEEGIQGVPEDTVQHGATVQADPSKKWDPAGSLAQNMVAGFAMGSGGHGTAFIKDRIGSSTNQGDPNGNQKAPGQTPQEVLTPGAGGQAINASEILGATADTGAIGTSNTDASEKALRTPVGLTSLDRVNEIDKQLETTPEDPQLQSERAALTKDWPAAVPGAAAPFSTESGARLEGQYALMDVDGLVTSHDANLRANPAYPPELQPRERDRAASELQVSSIVQRLDPARLGLSADAATGAPIVGADGLVESGNARTIALKRVYQANGQKAADYKQYLADNAAQFGLTPESVQAMAKPVLVRVRATPVNRAEFARQANASTVAAMSPSEQAKSDANRIDSMEDLRPDESGDFVTSRDFIRRFVGRLPITEQAGMMDSTGQLSSTGYARVRNAVLAKAYGDSPVIARMTESLDDNTRNISRALMTAAPKVAQVRQAIAQGNRFDADITPDLVAAVEELSRLKEDGNSVADALAQAGMFGDKYSPETRALMQFLADNIRRPKRMADFIVAYMDALDAAGDPNQGSLLGDVQAPGKTDLLNAAKDEINGPQDLPTNPTKDTQRGNPGEGAQAGQPDSGQSQNAPGDSRGNQGDGPADAASEWVNFPKDSGTIGIPRADMPQIKGEHRGALIQFLQGRGISHETKDVPASSLKPTQAEFSTKKAEKWATVREGSDRSVLVSSDGHILDGHHQWVAALAANEPIQAIVMDAPIRELMTNVFQFPSVKQSDGATTEAEGNRIAAREDFKAAMGELADYIHSKIGGKAMMMPSDAQLHKILVKLFDAAIAEVGSNLKDAIAHVKKLLKAGADTRTYWNKITQKAYQDAALASLEAAATAKVDDLFSAAETAMQGDLFSSNPAPSKAAKNGIPADWVLSANGKEYTDANGFVRGLKMSEKERAVEQAFYDQILSNEGALIERYFQDVLKPKDGLLVDPDRVKELSPDFLSDRSLANAVHEPSSALSKKIFNKLMGEAGGKPVIFTAGGGGSGKTEAMGIAAKVADVDPKGVIFDSTLSSFASAVKKIDSVLAAGGKADILYTNAPVEKAFAFAMHRPRVVKITDLAHAHQGASDTIRKLVEHYKGNAAVRVVLINNFGSLDQMHVGQIDQVPIYGYNETVRRLYEIAKQAANNGDISQERFDALTAGGVGDVLAGDRKDVGDVQGQVPIRNEGRLSEQSSQDGQGTSGQGGLNVNASRNNQTGNEGPGAATAEPTAQKRGTDGVRNGPGRSDQRGNRGAGKGDSGAPRVQPTTQDGSNESRGDNEHGDIVGKGNRVRGNVGVPAGRDIPPKSGLNYAFGDDDLTYKGSWPQKALQNIEAVELVKKLQTEGRQATREEQSKLAQFIGWGSSELANNLFGDKLNKVAAAMEHYNDAIKAWGDRAQVTNQSYSMYAPAFNLLRSKNESLTWYNTGTITRKMLDDAKPDGASLKWLAMRDRLKSAMTDAEWADAARSTQNAHYTSKPIVKSMWRALERMGFKGGHVLEPGSGIGVFPGLMPADMAANSSYTGIEFDTITGMILKQLFPDERILQESFFDSKLPKNFYDVGAGNPPFANFAVLSDPEYKKHAFSLHDYFFAKSIDRIKPGGLVMFVTSRYTMDKLDDKARAYLSERADLVGAIRLPQTAFKQNAGTDVVTDVLFLRKKVAGQTFDKAQPWGKSVPMQVGAKSFPVNEYYHSHPEMVLGVPSDTGKMANSPEPQYTVLASAGDIDAMFDKAVDALPTDIYQAERGSSAEAAKVREIDFNPKAKKEGNFYVTDAGVLMQREGGVGQRVDLKSPKDVEIVKDFVPLRDALKQAHYDQLNNGDWEASLAALQKSYAQFVKKNGQVNQYTLRASKVKSVDEETGETINDEVQVKVFTLDKKLRDDPDWTLVQALESINDDTGEITQSDFLTKRVLEKPAKVEVSTPIDAMLTTLNDIGKIDMDLIAQRVGLNRSEAIEALGTAVYLDPEGDWVTQDEYLSGNVKRKLELARAAAKSDRRYERNVDALVAAQPAPLAPSQIDPNIGMNWIPAAVYEKFISDITGKAVSASVEWQPATKSWHVGINSGKHTMEATSDWGTGSRNVVDLLEHALKGSPIRITRTEGSGADKKTVFDSAATEAAILKLKALQDKFNEWIFTDPDRTTDLVQIYNDKFNTTVPRSFDGRHLTLPGVSKTQSIFDHVKRGAWRIIQRGNTYLAHAVGSGKTYQSVIAAMEMKRLGLVKKPMMVVPNHMLKQFSSEWQQLYPAARLMVADEQNFHTDNRRRFVSRVALSDLDGVVITHSAFKLLDLDPEFKAKMIEEELTYLRAALVEAGGKPDAMGKSRDPKIKRIENQVQKREEQLKEAMSNEGKDKNARFDELGVDFLFVDEAHCFSYGTLIETNFGPMQIGDIVESKMNVLVKSRNSETHAIEYKPVTQWHKHAASDAFIEVTHEHGSFICTPNHNIFVKGAYKAAGALNPGDVLAVRSSIYSEAHGEARQENTVLQPGVSNQVHHHNQGVQNVREAVFLSHQRTGERCKTNVLLRKLSGKKSLVRSGASGELEGKDGAYMGEPSDARHQVASIQFANAGEQPNAQCGNSGEGVCHTESNWPSSEDQGREWLSDRATKTADVKTSFGFRVSDTDFADQGDDGEFAEALQGGSGLSTGKVSYRSGRKITSLTQESAEGRQEGQGFISSRVVGIKVLKRGSDGVHRFGGRAHPFVYDIGVEGNHNYFANGVLVSNSYRKLDFATTRQVKGIDPQGSQLAFDLYVKSRYLEEKTPGRSMVLMSGTPVTNTMAELYTVQKLMDRQAMIDKNVDDFDSWAAMFGRTTKSLEAGASGTYDMVERFNRFANVPELTQMFREFADVLTADYLGQLLGDKRPKVMGGTRKNVVAPKTDEYAEFQTEQLKPRVEASKAWKPSKDEPNNPDPIIAILADARLAAIDMRFMNPALPSNPDSKLNRMIDDVIAKFKETADQEYLTKDKKSTEPNKGSAIMVFADQGFGAGVAQNRGFNARAWFEKRMRDSGIPMEQVAFMSDFKKSDAKQKLFRDVNAGRVRVLVGSSKNMGTGVNAQQRLKAMFHLDAPWYPADLEQREGRIIRTGNKNPLVEIFAYATKGTYDQDMWAGLARKQSFIDKAMSGDANIRSIEDVSPASYMDQMSAAIADDPRVLQLAGIKADIDRYQRLYQAHEDTRVKLMQQYRMAEGTVSFNEVKLPTAEADAAKSKDLSGDKFTAKVLGQSYTDRAKWAEALIAQFKDRADRIDSQKLTVGEISGFPITYQAETVANIFRPVLRLETPVLVDLVSDAGTSPVGVAMRAQNAVIEVARTPAKMRERIATAKAEMEAVGARMHAPFQFKQELADATKERDDLIAELAAPKPEPEAAPEQETETLLSRGATPGGMDFKALGAVVEGIKSKMANLPKVNVLSDPSKAPAKLQAFIKERGAWGDVEGAMHEGELYMFASGLSGPLRAEHVLLEHESAHVGLRAILGRSLPGVMHMLWLENSKIRKAVTDMQARDPKMSLTEAVEESIVDIPSNELIRLGGWRQMVLKVRNWLSDHGFDAMAEKITRFLNGTLAYQQRADMMVADLVRNARLYVKRGAPAPAGMMADITRLSENSKTLAEDIAKQERWLNTESRARGYKDIDDLVDRNYPLFEKLATLWREKNPAENGVLLSRARENAYAKAVRLWQESLKSRLQPGTNVDMPMPTVYKALGLKPSILSLPVRYLQGIAEKHTDLPANVLLDLPQLLSDPVVVIPYKDGGYRAMVDAVTAKGEPIVVGVGVDGRVQTVTPIHTLGKVSGRDAFATMVNDQMAKEGVKVYARNKEALAKTRALGGIADGYAAVQPLDVSSSLAGPAIIALPRGSRDKAIVMFRDQAVKREGDFGPGIRLSRATLQDTAEARADKIIATKAATRAPLDAMANLVTKVTGIEKVLGLVYKRAGVLLDRYTPETVKAGLISDYGVPEAVIDQRTRMQGNQRQQLRGAGALIEKLSSLTRAESRVAYEWMNMDGSDPKAYLSMMSGLPEESVKVLQETQQLIDKLSQEAIRLGQLSAEAYSRNKFAYLRRSYFKHTAELTKGEAGKRARVISVLGDQYKGRGMSDSAAMSKIQNIAPDWWKRKLQAGKADASLKGDKFIRMERRAPSGEKTSPLDGMETKAQGKLLEIQYYPAGEALPAKYKDWTANGTWEVRDVKGGNLVMWRDFTKEERETMGEIDEARFAIAKTLHGMIHDVEVGKYLEWLGQKYAKLPGEKIDGVVVEASEKYRDTFKPTEWVQVPDTKIPGTSVLKYGKLSGQFIPGPIWNDLRQVMGGQFKPFGETYANILRAWKTSKTALSPAVHTNNIMSNFVMADWHDVSAGHVSKAMRIIMAASRGTERAGLGGKILRAGTTIGIADDQAAVEIMNRYRDSGGDIGSWATQEIRDEQMKPLLDSLEKELAATAGASVQAQIGVMSAVHLLLHKQFPQAWDALKGSKPVKTIGTEGANLIDLYQSEDDVFRLAAWLRAKEEGKTDLEAGKASRESFLDYRINAPWVQAMRASALPFISFSYRAIPMMLNTAANKPHKLMKLMMLAGAVNAFGLMMAGGGGDDDKERKLLPEEKAGKIWGMVPKLLRMPWNDAHGSPVYLDIRRYIPVGDMFDTGAGHSALPMLPFLTVGGPLAMLGELIGNKSNFTGKPITLETDTTTEKVGKVFDYLYKAFAPNIIGLPGTYATTGVLDSLNGKTDKFGRELSPAQAMASSFGIKLGSYPADVMRQNLQGAAQAQIMEIQKNITGLKRQLQTHSIDQAEFAEKVKVQQEKMQKVQRDLMEKLR